MESRGGQIKGFRAEDSGLTPPLWRRQELERHLKNDFGYLGEVVIRYKAACLPCATLRALLWRAVAEVWYPPYNFDGRVALAGPGRAQNPSYGEKH